MEAKLLALRVNSICIEITIVVSLAGFVIHSCVGMYTEREERLHPVNSCYASHSERIIQNKADIK